MITMRIRIDLRPLLLATAVAIAAGGCSKGVKLLPVSGTVTYKDKPVPRATVLFAPEKGPAATGVTDAAGRYTLKTSKLGEGAVVGKHAVSITAGESPDYDPLAPGAGPPPAVKWLIPEKYASAATSGLSVTVSNQQTDYSFKLQ
jgi:hypothetical protein